MATSDVGGRLLTLTDRNLRKQTFSYDDLARVTEEDWFNADGSSAGSSTTSRDPDNNVLSVTNSSGTVQFTYDNLNRVKTAKDVWGVTLTYTTDALDRHTRIDDSLGGSLTATYDAGGELTDETRSAAGLPTAAVHWSYDSAEQVSQQTDIGTVNIYTSYTRDDIGRITEQDSSSANSPIETLTSTYDPVTGLSSQETRIAWRTAGDPAPGPTPPPPTQATQSNPDFSYTTAEQYDVYGQFTKLANQAFYCDDSNNLDPSGTLIGPGNRLLADLVWNYSCDGEGNLIQKVRRADGLTWTYSYDNLNHLTQAQQWSGTPGQSVLLSTSAYQYDGLGRLVSVNGVRSVLDGTTPYAEVDGGTTLQVAYLTGPGGVLLARQDHDSNGQPRRLWYVTDRQGAVIDLLDDGGAALKRLNQSGFQTQKVYQPSGVVSGWVPLTGGGWRQVSWPRHSLICCLVLALSEPSYLIDSLPGFA